MYREKDGEILLHRHVDALNAVSNNTQAFQAIMLLFSKWHTKLDTACVNKTTVGIYNRLL